MMSYVIGSLSPDIFREWASPNLATYVFFFFFELPPPSLSGPGLVGVWAIAVEEAAGELSLGPSMAGLLGTVQKSSQLVLVLVPGIFAPLLRLLFHASSTIPFHSSTLFGICLPISPTLQ